jgi:hypothetical protein
MEATEKSSTRRILIWSVPIVLAHFLAVVWHLLLLVKVQPDTPGFLPPLLILINLFPVAGLVAFAKGFPKFGGIMIIIPLGVALVAGVYAHFLSLGADNVLRMPPGELRLSFQVSAALLVVLEGLGCWVGLRMLANAPMKQAHWT